MRTLQDAFGQYSAPDAIGSDYGASVRVSDRPKRLNNLLSYWLVYGDSNLDNWALQRLDNVGWGHLEGDDGPRVWRMLRNLGSLPMVLRQRIDFALRAGLSYAEVLQRMAAEVRAAGLGDTANSFEAAATAAAASPLPTNQVGSALSRRSQDPNRWGFSYMRPGGLSESAARAIAGDARASEWKAREAAARASLGWPQPVSNVLAAAVATAGKVIQPMNVQSLNSQRASQIAAAFNRMNTAPVMQPRALTASASASGTSETGLWIIGGLLLLGGVYMIAKKSKRL